MNWWQLLLFPFAIIYDMVTRMRNYLYDTGHKKSFQFEKNIIVVGNLTVGGTGKTPMICYLIDFFLKHGKQVAVLSRGYGRKTKGFRICTCEDTPETVGDEPFTYYDRYGDNVMVTVGENRVLAIPFIFAEKPTLDVILLDDAFQHRSMKPSLSILLTTHKRPFWEDFLLPSGWLREAGSGAKRADIVIVTKSKRMQSYKELAILNKPYYQTGIKYGKPVLFFGSFAQKKVVLVSGLADNQEFIVYASQHFEVIRTFEFKDHHPYSSKDVDRIMATLENAMLLTTHKDAVKLRQFYQLQSHTCAYLPIEVKFLADEEHFLRLVNKRLINYSTSL